MNKIELYIFMFYVPIITLCMIASLFVFRKYNINLWYALITGIMVGMLISYVLWTFYGKSYVKKLNY